MLQQRNQPEDPGPQAGAQEEPPKHAASKVDTLRDRFIRDRRARDRGSRLQPYVLFNIQSSCGRHIIILRSFAPKNEFTLVIPNRQTNQRQRCSSYMSDEYCGNGRSAVDSQIQNGRSTGVPGKRSCSHHRQPRPVDALRTTPPGRRDDSALPRGAFHPVDREAARCYCPTGESARPLTPALKLHRGSNSLTSGLKIAKFSPKVSGSLQRRFTNVWEGPARFASAPVISGVSEPRIDQKFGTPRWSIAAYPPPDSAGSPLGIENVGAGKSRKCWHLECTLTHVR